MCRTFLRHDGEVVDERRGGEESVHIRQRRMRADFSPALGDGVIDREYTVAEPLADFCHPSVEHDAEPWVAAADARRPAPKLADHQDAEIELLRLALPKPGDDALVGAAPACAARTPHWCRRDSSQVERARAGARLIEVGVVAHVRERQEVIDEASRRSHTTALHQRDARVGQRPDAARRIVAEISFF